MKTARTLSVRRKINSSGLNILLTKSGSTVPAAADVTVQESIEM